ncbi:MAG: ATP-binding protein, partial [Deltaproteobacteria bacterium]|nr:ATP-binding protein [Deltaproteobacteria bacterium]
MIFDYLRTSYAFVIPPILGFFVLIFLSLISFLRGPRRPTNILFAVICFMGSLINADVALVSIIPDKTLALTLDRMIYFLFVFSLPIYLQFVHTFLYITGRRWVERLAYLFSLLFLFFIFSDHFISGFHEYSFGTIAKAGPIFYFFSVMSGFTVCYCLLTLFMAMKTAEDNQRRNRIKYILGGMGMSALLIALNILPVIGFNIYPMGNFSFIPAVFLAFGVFLPFILSLFMVLLFDPIRTKVQAVIDKLFFRGKYDYQQLLKDISWEMSSLLKFDQIKNLLLETIATALQVIHVCLLIDDGEQDAFRVYSHAPEFMGERCQSAIHRSHPMVTFLEEYKGPLGRSVIERKLSRFNDKQQILQVFDDMRATLIVPLISKSQLMGFLALGQKKSGQLFVQEDIELLSTMANQSVTAIDNARMYEALERMNRDLEKKVELRTAALRQALEEKERTQKQLIQSESLAAIGQLVAGTAHELNNPLASALSLVQTCTDSVRAWDVKAESCKEVLDDLDFSLKEIRRAAEIVKSLLGLSRQTQTYVEPIHINATIDDALRVLHNQYKHLDVNIERQYAEQLPDVQGNFANLGQVFINVIKNAIQSLPEGKGKIILNTSYDQRADRVMITCGDTGTGIPMDQIKDIFKPFFTTKTVGQGSGLGIYISHEIIKKHGGS